MPSVLITTSRRTSNRVRSFVRDLSTVFPDCDRFNRGSLNQEELFARIQQEDARSLIIVTIFRGNPDSLMVYNYNGDLILDIKIESAILRRELLKQKTTRMSNIAYLCITPESKAPARSLVEFLSYALDTEPIETNDIPFLEDGSHYYTMRIETKGSKIIWTCYQANTGVEIGPRIRIKEIRSTIGE